jgi:steroid delta-isomerase-like uncharacterized protein
MSEPTPAGRTVQQLRYDSGSLRHREISAMNENANKICIVKHFDELWNQGQTERVDEFFSPDFVNFGVRYSELRGVIQRIVAVWRTAFPDLRFTIDELIGEDETVMCEATLSGTHLGDFLLIPPLHGPTLPPNGKKFSVKHIHRFRLRDGKIIEHFAVRDDLGMFQQLGHLSLLNTAESYASP